MKRALRILGLALCAALCAAPVAAQTATPPPPPPAPRGWIGVSYETELVQEGLRLRPVSRVVAVREGGPAAVAGIRAGDVLLSVNGRTWEEQFSKGVPMIRAGDPVSLVLEREGRRREIRLMAGRWPEEEVPVAGMNVTVMPDSVVDRLYLAMDSLRVRIVEDEGLRHRLLEIQVAADSAMDDLARERVVHLRRAAPGGTVNVTPFSTPEPPSPYAVWLFTDSLRDSLDVRVELGIPFSWPSGKVPADVVEFRPTVPYVLGENRAAGAEVVELRPELAQYFGVDGGVLVVDVAPGTPADRAGIQPGDVLTHVQGIAIGSIADLRRGLVRGGDEAPLTLIRKGRTLQVALKR